jgi:hypothetical protein
MPKLFSFIKNKKAIFSIFLFLVVLMVAVPQITYADWLTTIGKWNPFNSVGKLWCLLPGEFSADACASAKEISKASAESGIWSVVPNMVSYVFAGMGLVVGVILVTISSIFSIIAASLFEWLLTILKSLGCYSCMENPIIALGWPKIRDLGNMVIILGFVVIGIATALRFKDYEAKKLLGKLIIAALLINFSLLICGIVIDGTNIISGSFMANSTVGPTEWNKAVGNQVQIIWCQWKKSDWKQAAAGIISSAAGLTFYNIVMIIVFLLYFFLYLFRIIAIWILVILSPLAFVLSVFPGTRKFFDMWWSNFFQWCFIIVPISFFFWISNQILAGFSKAPQPPMPGVDAACLGSQAMSPLMFMIPGAFMIIGLIFSLQFSALGASMATGAFRATSRGAKKLGGAGMELAGRTSMGQRTREGLASMRDKIAEGTGFAKRGYAAQQKQARVAEAEKQVGALAAAPAGSRDRARFEQLVRSGTGSMGAAAVNKANERKELGTIMGKDKKGNLLSANDALQATNGRVAFAGQFGYSRSNFEDNDHQLRGLNQPAIDAYKRSHSGATDDEARRAVETEQLRKNIKGYSASQLGKIESHRIFDHTKTFSDPENQSRYDFFKRNFTADMLDQINTTGNQDLRDSFKAHLGAVGMAGTLADDMDKANTSGNKAEYTRLKGLHDAINRMT